mmetsp:Transcript_73256/g.129115  ORF Transcript_73256/g.129115 Transcript_73256/m.129115 type:complete len:94 (+) Transcript_73256:596-877(+)
MHTDLRGDEAGHTRTKKELCECARNARTLRAHKMRAHPGSSKQDEALDVEQLGQGYFSDDFSDPTDWSEPMESWRLRPSDVPLFVLYLSWVCF